MAKYYTITEGKRYDASLIDNAKFRTRGPGEGQISLEEAKQLWQIVMDGSRITETEEATLQYLLRTMDWTDAARTWMEEAMTTEATMVTSYYKIINGLRYDQKILVEADRLTSGQGDGRISLADAEVLLPLFGDFGDVTVVEERTLKYLRTNYNWTPQAEQWFLERIDPISKQSDIGGLLRYIMEQDFVQVQLPFVYFKSEALQQTLDYTNKVTLPDALRLAMNSLLNDTTERSFGALIDAEMQQEFLDGGRLVLLPGSMASEPALSSFPAPSRGESIQSYWIFGLELFDLTDDIYWVLVARDGSEPAYNYLGGPNVGDIYHTVEEDTYFTITVKSCDIPYPDITVEVQDPTGKHIVGKSDAAGKVLFNGPAGNYSIYASDGWSSQSKSFDWNGVGTEQGRDIVLDC